MTQKLQTHVLALNANSGYMCFANSKVKKQAMKSVVKVDRHIDWVTKLWWNIREPARAGEHLLAVRRLLPRLAGSDRGELSEWNRENWIKQRKWGRGQFLPAGSGGAAGVDEVDNYDWRGPPSWLSASAYSPGLFWSCLKPFEAQFEPIRSSCARPTICARSL